MDYIYLLTVQFNLQNSILVLLFSSTLLPHFCCFFPHFLLVQCLLILGSWLPSSWLPSLDIGVVLSPTVNRSLLVRCHVVDVEGVVDDADVVDDASVVDDADVVDDAIVVDDVSV